MSLQVKNIKTEVIELKPNEYLKKINSYITKHCKIADPMKLLPTKPYEKMTFELHDTYAEFANSIRRILVEELPTKVLLVDERNIETDDRFVISDLLIRNITLIPINQELDHIDSKKIRDSTIDTAESISQIGISEKNDDNKTEVSLDIFNKNSYIIDVKAKDLKTNVALIPNDNIIVMRLHPNKHIKINKIKIDTSYSWINGCYCMLGSVKYKKIDDVKDYDIITDQGNRSITYDPQSFRISFTTKGNISLKRVIELLYLEFLKKLVFCRKNITEYESNKQNNSNYYYSDHLEVHIDENYSKYSFKNEYITLVGAVAKRCYILDPEVTFCAFTAERFDSNVGIIKIKHSNPNKLLIDAVNHCIEDLIKLKNALLDAVK